VAVLLDLLQAGLEGVDDGHVTVQREDQGHVDVDALGQYGGDGLQPHKGGEDLDQDVVLIHRLEEVVGWGGCVLYLIVSGAFWGVSGVVRWFGGYVYCRGLGGPTVDPQLARTSELFAQRSLPLSIQQSLPEEKDKARKIERDDT
jgi:hypothetical protein